MMSHLSGFVVSGLLSGIWYCLDYILVIGKSYLSKWSHTYDMIQYKQQGKQTNKHRGHSRSFKESITPVDHKIKSDRKYTNNQKYTNNRK